MKVNLYGKDYKISRIETGKYANNMNLSIQLYCIEDNFEEPFATLTVNLRKLNTNNQAFVDTNNCPWAEKFIQENKLGVFKGILESSGYCVYPLYSFDMERLEELENG